MKLQEDTGESLSVIGLDNDFSNVTSKAQSIKEQIDMLDFIKKFKCLHFKRHCRKDKPQAVRNSLQVLYLVSKIYKNLLQVTNRKQTINK